MGSQIYVGKKENCVGTYLLSSMRWNPLQYLRGKWSVNQDCHRTCPLSWSDCLLLVLRASTQDVQEILIGLFALESWVLWGGNVPTWQYKSELHTLAMLGSCGCKQAGHNLPWKESVNTSSYIDHRFDLAQCFWENSSMVVKSIQGGTRAADLDGYKPSWC